MSLWKQNQSVLCHPTFAANNGKQKSTVSFRAFHLFIYITKKLKWKQIKPSNCSYSAALLHLLANFRHLFAWSLFSNDKVKIAFPHKDYKNSFFSSEQVMRLNSGLLEMYLKGLIISEMKEKLVKITFGEWRITTVWQDVLTESLQPPWAKLFCIVVLLPSEADDPSPPQ